MAQSIADGLLVVVLAAAAVSDMARGRIYNWLTYPAALAGLALWAAGGYVDSGWAGAGHGLKSASLGLLVGFVPMAVAFYLGGIGGGDAKLAAAVGALARPWLTIYALFYGFLAGGAIAVVVMIRKRIVRRTAGRIWRFLWIASLRGPARPVSPSDASSPRIPFGLALCLGTLWALVEQRVFDGKTVLDWIIRM